MPVYNGERYLREAIESILNQTFTGFEFVILNDGSTDRSAEIVRSYDDPRIRFYENDHNIGLTLTLNRGLRLLEGEYVARMDADDISVPHRLAKQVDFLDTHADVGVVGTAITIIDEKARIVTTRHHPPSHNVLRWCLCLFDPIAHPTALMRRHIVESAGGYQVETGTAEDYDLWRRLSREMKLANLPDVLLYLRRHTSNVTVIRLAEHREYRVRVSQMMISEYLGDNPPYDVVRSIWNQDCGSADEVRRAAFLVSKIYEKGMTGSALALSEKRFMRSYTASKLLRLAYRGNETGRAWDVIALALRLDPLVAAKMVKGRLARIMRHRFPTGLRRYALI